ncbi:MAG: hypothetical protein JRF45_09515 [Deltaproteobacteria bacterium]|nr:hypothetical protein [Deltaproteobacteria bacterium]MBW1970265.1 hypothetical protein [Deltaproteobacteria bacterium]MBW2156235.1 hypothetical protein [Deltaproteobacteria bacterium]MBW2197983.1 hypothetical protein [Deltaproteobacteria bacterium]MBW2227123.1 hypothetical protein [Deltaproteobacteria bacterium]
MNKPRFSIMLLILLPLFGCSLSLKNYGQVKMLPKGPGEVVIQDLIDNWEDYDIYYAGSFARYYGVRNPLGVMFDPKNNDTTLVGDRWEKVRDQKTLIEITQMIYPNTQHDPWLSEILGPDDRFYGYLYYSYGMVVLNLTDDGNMYVYDLEEPSGGYSLF